MLLQPVLPLYVAATWVDRWMKQRGALRSRLPVVSVGNISSGGTGKTQVVAWLVGHFQKRSPVLILSRGYGRLSAEDLVLPAEGAAPDPALVGDEPALLYANLQRGAVGVARNRSRLLRQLESQQEFRDAIVLLDDGFQHWRIKRDIDIVLVDDATVEGCLIPAGELRERHTALSRADLLIATSESAEEFLLKRHEPSRVVRLRQSNVRFLVDNREVSPSELGTLLAVAGIARPERFIQTLHDAGGVDIGDSLIYDDHRRYGKGEIDTIVARLAQLGAKYVVTTSKDAVKLSRVPELVGRLCVVEVGIEIDREGEVFGMIDRVVARVRSEGV